MIGFRRFRAREPVPARAGVGEPMTAFLVLRA
jgi:hypothetical protein